MKVLVTGARGQLGQTLLANAPAGVTIIGTDRAQMDISDQAQVAAVVKQEAPDVIVNTAAYSAVDLAESNVAEATRVNTDGPHFLAVAAKDAGARLIHLSTDFVFDGAAREPYAPDATAHPLGVYGATKYAGELQVRETLPEHSVILRTSWLYSKYGGNFTSTMLRLMAERDELSVVDDQVGCPTWARSVANAIFAFAARSDLAGTYHWADAGQTSWFEFACAIQAEAVELRLIRKAIDVRAISSKDYQAAAKRPAYSVLDCSVTVRDLDIAQTLWRQNLRAMLTVSAKQ